jgi:hypothetical protein
VTRIYKKNTWESEEAAVSACRSIQCTEMGRWASNFVQQSHVTLIHKDLKDLEEPVSGT